jgi:hypothetical protein|nr:MAG TPA_asm: hypothetical protein [Caudoviricetes sp.]
MSDIPNKFAFCCLPVLPTIFSDELSYLDVLSKMRDYINQMIDALKQQDEDIANIQKQVDKVDPSKYILTSGGTLTGPLFFIDQNSVVKNADGTFTVQSNNPLVIKTGQTAAVNATGGVEIRSGGTVLVTGNDGVSILDKSSAGVAVFEGNTAIAGNIEINGPTTFGNVDVDMVNARTKVMNLHGDRNVTIDTPESIAIVADKHVDITGSTGVEIIASENGAVNIEGGAVAMTGDIYIHGPTTFDKVDVDMTNARTKVAEPVEDENPATKKYVDAHGGVTCGYITVAVDDTKNTVDVHSENLIPNGELGGYYVDNAGNLWRATQVVAGGFTLDNQNINVLANAGFVKITGNTNVKNINVNDTGSSTYQATTNVLVHGGTDVDITAGKGTVGIEGPIVDIHAAKHMNIVTGSNGDIIIGVNRNTMLLSDSNISLSSQQLGDAGIARLIDVAYNAKAQFGNFTIAAQSSTDYRVFMIEGSSGAPIANVTAPVFMVFSAASRGVRDGIAVDSAGVIYKVIHNYNHQSFEMTKQTPNAGGAAMKQFDTTNGEPMIPIADIPSSGGAIFYMTITMGDKNYENNSQLYNGSITTYNGEVTDVRILNIGWLSSGDPVVCEWVDSGKVTKTTDGIQLGISATDVGFTGWYAKLS